MVPALPMHTLYPKLLTFLNNSFSSYSEDINSDIVKYPIVAKATYLLF